jgi:hypothetical protein
VYINNVKQEEGSGKAYTASGTTITFSEAVASGDSCYLVYMGSAQQTVTAPAGSIVSSQFSSADLSLTGNLGIGITPDSISNGNALQVNRSLINDDDGGSTHITQNGYYDSAWKYVENGTAEKITFATGATTFSNATSNSSGADASLTWVDNMVIDANGHITKPKQSAFLAVSNSTQSNIAANTTTTISFNYEVFDQNADYNTSNYTFTAPVTGRYQLNAQIYMYQMPENGGYSLININTSNRAYLDIFTNSAHDSEITYNSLKIACLADMDANDTATVSFYQQQGTAQADIQGSGSNAGNTQFSGFLVA